LTIQTGDLALWANVLLTMGCRTTWVQKLLNLCRSRKTASRAKVRLPPGFVDRCWSRSSSVDQRRPWIPLLRLLGVESSLSLSIQVAVRSRCCGTGPGSQKAVAAAVGLGASLLVSRFIFFLYLASYRLVRWRREVDLKRPSLISSKWLLNLIFVCRQFPRRWKCWTLSALFPGFRVQTRKFPTKGITIYPLARPSA